MVGGTVVIWARAVATGRELDEQRDAPRIRRAFITLQAEAKEWPVPRDLINALPVLRDRPANVVRLVDEQRQEQTKRRLANIAECLAKGMDPRQVDLDGKMGAPADMSLQKHARGETA